jgi:IMP dehydrogenase
MKTPAIPRIEDYYLPAETFFASNLPVGLTYDDISLATLFSDVLPRQTNLSTRLSDALELQIPIISSDMDTVTESKMAIQMALNGGMGLIHYSMSDENQIGRASCRERV